MVCTVARRAYSFSSGRVARGKDLSVYVCVGLWRMKIRNRSLKFQIIDDFDGSVGAARKRNRPVLLILTVDDTGQDYNP